MMTRTATTYLCEIDRTPLLSADEERELALRVGDGDPEARDRLVRANLRLVVRIARSRAGRGLPLDDLIAEGNLGLIRAAEGFDPTVGVRFSTYAAHWIKQAIRRAVQNQGSFVRLPAYTATLLAKWRRAAAALEEGLGRRPTAEEVGGVLGLTPKRTLIALEALGAERCFAGQEAGDGGEGPELDAAPGREASPLEELVARDGLSRVLEGLGRLDWRQAAVVRLRFGLATGRPATLREVGERLGLTRERIRQLEKLALASLRRYAGEWPGPAMP